MATIVLGKEFDPAVWKRARKALRSIGARRDSSDWAVAGSQEISREEWRAGDARLILEGETYVGLSLTGPDEQVAAVAIRFQAGARSQGADMRSLPQATIVAAAAILAGLDLWLRDSLTQRAIHDRTDVYSLPWVTHGGTVYVSQWEMGLRTAFWPAAACLVGAQLILNCRRRPN